MQIHTYEIVCDHIVYDTQITCKPTTEQKLCGTYRYLPTCFKGSPTTCDSTIGSPTTRDSGIGTPTTCDSAIGSPTTRDTSQVVSSCQ